MPRIVSFMLVLGGAVLLAGLMLPRSQDRPGFAPEAGPSLLPGNAVVGRSALSHGGPGTPPKERRSLFRVGQEVELAGDEGNGAVVLVDSAPFLPNGERAVKIVVPPGTVGLIRAVEQVGEEPAQRRPYYQVALKDGRVGWLPEASLRRRH